MKPKVHILLWSLGGLFLLLDQWLKYLVLQYPDRLDFVGRWMGWQLLKNPGVAFGAPVPNMVLLVVTPLFLLGLFVLLSKQRPISTHALLGGILITSGALSNFIDRVILGVTIDYIQIFTAVINVADIAIVVGALFLLFHKKT